MIPGVRPSDPEGALNIAAVRGIDPVALRNDART